MGLFSFLNSKKEQEKKGTISDFVDSKFASFDRTYGKTTRTTNDEIGGGGETQEALQQETHESPLKNVEHDGTLPKADNHNRNANTNHKETTAVTTTDPKNNPADSTNDPKREKTQEEMDEEEAYATLTYLALLTCLYLPLLLFLWIRRSVFGATSLIRSLFLGHLLRLLLAFLLLPPSTTQSFLPVWLWNLGVKVKTKARKFWNSSLVQRNVPSWVHGVIALLFLDADLGHPDHGHGHTGHGGRKQGPGSSSAKENKDTWPPPALMGLAIFTLLAFVVHPDGLTWMIFGQVSEWIHNTASKGAETIRMIRDGSLQITPSMISSTLATIIIIVTVVNHVYTNKYNTSEASSKNRLNNKDAAGVSKKHKHKRGKKGGGKMRHSHSSGGGGSGGRGRIRNSSSGTNTNQASSSSVSVGGGSDHEPNESKERRRPKSRSPSPVFEQSQSPDEHVQGGLRLRNGTKTATDGEKPSRTSGKDKSRIGSNLQRHSQPSPEVPLEDDKSISSFPSVASSLATTQSSTVESSTSNSTRNKRGRKKGKKSPGSQGTGKVVFSQSQSPGSGSGEARTRVGGLSKAAISRTNDRLSTTLEKSVSNSTTVQSNHSRDTTQSSSNSRVSIASNSVNKRERRNRNKQREWGSPNRVSSIKSDMHSPSSEKKLANGRVSNPNTPSREQTPDYQHYSKSSFFSEASLESRGSSRLNRRRSFTDPERNLDLSHRISPEPVSPSPSASSLLSESVMSAGLIPSLPGRVSNSSSSRYQVHEPLIAHQQDSTSSDSVISRSQNNTNQNMLGDVRYSPGKLELATFLAQVGLIGNDAQSLLLDLDDINALERLTSEDMEVIYSIGSRIRSDIFSMLDARRVRMGHERTFDQTRRDDSWSSNGLVRPPPGLVPSQDPLVDRGSVSNLSINSGSSNLMLDSNIPRVDEPQQMLSYLAPSASNSSGTSFAFSSTFDKAIGIPQRPQSSVPIPESSSSINFNLPTLSPLDPPLTSSNGNAARRGFPTLQNEDEEIEADLRALGGQMAGSILDF